MKNQIFKAYEQNQPMFLPPSLEEMIPVGHLVRVVNQMIEQINPESHEQRQYKGGLEIPVMSTPISEHAAQSREVIRPIAALAENDTGTVDSSAAPKVTPPKCKILRRFTGIKVVPHLFMLTEEGF